MGHSGIDRRTPATGIRVRQRCRRGGQAATVDAVQFLVDRRLQARWQVDGQDRVLSRRSNAPATAPVGFPFSIAATPLTNT